MSFFMVGDVTVVALIGSLLMEKNKYKKDFVYLCYHHKRILDSKTILEKECYDCKYYLKFTPKQFQRIKKIDSFWETIDDKVLENWAGKDKLGK